MKKNFLVTGRPGIGKTTCVMRTAELLRGRGLRVGGMVTLEQRAAGRRVGFKVIDLETGAEDWLARAGVEGPVRVGRYAVFLENLERVGVAAVRRCVGACDVVVVDEIGPMELKSRAFREAVWEALDSGTPVLATIHVAASRNPFGRRVLGRSDVELYRVTFENREELPRVLAEKILGTR